MYRLITFGGLTLVSDHASVTVTTASMQRSRLALLAVLARAGTTGISRDKLLAYLWPDSDTERARHALKQAIYATRRDLHNETVIAGTAVLTLDVGVISSDVRDFDDACARGDDQTAVSLYAGPFLDGVFIRTAAEFDRWCEVERTGLKAAFLAACDRLARVASNEGRHADAVRLWQQASASDPLSGHLAVNLMQALAESGDLTGALRYAAVHEKLVRNELECAPDGAVLDCASQLRSGAWRPESRGRLPFVGAPPGNAHASAQTRAPTVVQPHKQAREPTRGEPELSSPAIQLEKDPALSPLRASSPTPDAAAASTDVRRALRRRPGLLALAAVVATAILATTLAMGSISAETRRTLRIVLTRAPAPLAPRRIVAAPFVNRTGDPSLNPLGELTSAWITRSLLEADFEIVDARTSAVASRVIAQLPRLLRERDESVALAEETGAGIVLSGSYYLQGDSLGFTATISDVTRGTVVRAIGPLRGQRGQSAALIEALARRVTAALTASTDSTAGGATASLVAPPSVEAYERTSHAWEMFFSRPADTAAVFAELARATATDSAYSAPLLMRAYVLDVNERWASLNEVVRTLESRRATLGRAERAALDLFTADLRGDLLGRLRAARELARLSPGSVDMALLVAVSACYVMRPHEGSVALQGTDPDRGINLLSPMYWAWRAATAHALENYDGERFAAEEGRRRFPSAPATAIGRVRVAAVRGDLGDLDQLLKEVRARSEPEAAMLTQLAGRELRAHGHPDAAQRLFVRAAGRAAPPASATRAERHEHAMAQYEAGHLGEARRIYASVFASDSTDIEALARLGTIAARSGDTATAKRVDGRLNQWASPYSLGAAPAWRAHLAALDNRPADAVTLLRMAVSQGFRMLDLGVVGVHDDGDFARMRGDARFAELVRPRDGPLRLP